jgi:hypothetical protein
VRRAELTHTLALTKPTREQRRLRAGAPALPPGVRRAELTHTLALTKPLMQAPALPPGVRRAELTHTLALTKPLLQAPALPPGVRSSLRLTVLSYSYASSLRPHTRVAEGRIHE